MLGGGGTEFTQDVVQHPQPRFHWISGIFDSFWCHKYQFYRSSYQYFNPFEPVLSGHRVFLSLCRPGLESTRVHVDFYLCHRSDWKGDMLDSLYISITWRMKCSITNRGNDPALKAKRTFSKLIRLSEACFVTQLKMVHAFHRCSRTSTTTAPMKLWELCSGHQKSLNELYCLLSCYHGNRAASCLYYLEVSAR